LKNLQYEVYTVRDPVTGDVVYVGEGRKGRHLHVNSGVSHVYTLNKGHFAGVTWDVSVELCESKKLASVLENKFIEEFDPICNILGTRRYKYKYNLANLCKLFQKYTDKPHLQLVRRSLIPHGLMGCDINEYDQIVLKREHFVKGVSDALVKYGIQPTDEFDPEKVWKTMRYAVIQELKYLSGLLIKIEKVPNSRFWLLDINWQLLETGSYENIYEQFIVRK
jgi:hypothetical protein